MVIQIFWEYCCEGARKLIVDQQAHETLMSAWPRRDWFHVQGSCTILRRDSFLSDGRDFSFYCGSLVPQLLAASGKLWLSK